MAGHTEIIGYLLDNGAEINAQDVLGLNPLMAAVAAGSISSVKLLTDRGADVNAESNMFPNETAMTTAVRLGNAEIIEMLKNASA